MFFGLTNHYKNYYVQHHAKSKLCNSWAIYCNYTIITLYKKYIHLNKNNFIWLFYVNMIKWLFKVDNWSSRHKFVRLLEEEIKLLIKSDFAGLKKLLLTSLLMLSLYIYSKLLFFEDFGTCTKSPKIICFEKVNMKHFFYIQYFIIKLSIF